MFIYDVNIARQAERLITDNEFNIVVLVSLAFGITIDHSSKLTTIFSSQKLIPSDHILNFLSHRQVGDLLHMCMLAKIFNEKQGWITAGQFDDFLLSITVTS